MDGGTPVPGPIELRIHGVSGAPPDRLLHGRTVLVDGHDRSGFHRRVDAPDGPLEAYSWGGMTSGPRRSAFWVLMLPFAVLNVAGWMGRASPSRAHVACVRLAGLLLSGLYGLAAVAIFVDLGAHRRVWGWWDWTAAPEIARAVAGLLAASLPVGTALLAGRSRRRFEEPGAVPSPQGDPTRRARLGGPTDLWNRPEVVEALGLANLSFALGSIAAVLGQAGRVLGGDAPRWVSMAALAGGMILVVAAPSVVIAQAARPGLTGSLARLNGSAPWWVLVGSTVGLGVTAMALVPDPGGPGTGALPGLPGGLTAAITAFVVLWLVYAGAVRRGGMGGQAPSAAFLVISAGLLLSLAAGTARLAAGRRYPEAYAVDHLALAFAVTLLAEIAVAASLWLAAGRPRSDGERREADSVSTRTPLVRLRRATARFGALVATAALLPVLWLPALAAIAGLCPRQALPVVFTCPAQPVWGPFALPGSTGSAVFDVAAWVAVAGPALALALYLLRGPRSASLRRRVGVAWDLLTFWPRWYHPWAPPPYPEVAVADLSRRLETLDRDSPVTVSAHSQGSLLAVAAILDTSARPTLVTLGSPLTRFYARLFPTQVDAGLFGAVVERVRPGRWWNLWRGADPIAGPIQVEGVADVLVAEPLPDGSIGGHSRYEDAPEYVADPGDRSVDPGRRD